MAELIQKSSTGGDEFILYQTEDGRLKLEVRLEGETLWLSQQQLADLFQTTQQNISLHLRNVFEEGELQRSATHKEFLLVRQEGSREVKRAVDFYNLDVIISVGYRIKSAVATRLRIWATQRLKEYIVKGFTMDDDRLKRRGGGNYFEELLARIRDIRSSEKVFWRKVLDIYPTRLVRSGTGMDKSLIMRRVLIDGSRFEANAFAGRGGWFHKIADGIEDGSETGVVVLLKGGDFAG